MSQSEALRGIQRARKRRERAEDARREAMAELRDWCLRAQGEKVPLAQIAREAGLSRQAVYDLLRPS
jgi:AcrR family transcriptional regulator